MGFHFSLNLFGVLVLELVAVLLVSEIRFVSANTEIRNFDVALGIQDGSASGEVGGGVEKISRGGVDLEAPEHSRVISQWPIFTANASELSFKVTPAPLDTALQSICEEPPVTNSCAHQLWITLDLDDPRWRSFSKFTLRLSWPAFYPTDFDIAIYSFAEVWNLSSSAGGDVAQQRSDGRLIHTRRMHARIRLVDTGVRNPISPLALTGTEQVPFTIILEPLYLGAIPATVIPTVILLITLIALSTLCLLPSLNRYLGDVAKQAQSELVSRRIRRTKTS